MQLLGAGVRPCASAGEVLERSDVVVITTPWREFAHLPLERVADRERKPVLIDCWRLLGDEMAGAVEIVRLGTPLETHIAR